MEVVKHLKQQNDPKFSYQWFGCVKVKDGGAIYVSWALRAANMKDKKTCQIKSSICNLHRFCVLKLKVKVYYSCTVDT